MRTFLTNILPPTTGLIPTSGVLSSSALQMEYSTGLAIQARYAGGPTGTMSLLASNDGIYFVTIAGSGANITPNLAGSTGQYMWNLISPGFQYVKWQFSSTSASSGLMAVTAFSKGF